MPTEMAGQLDSLCGSVARGLCDILAEPQTGLE